MIVELTDKEKQLVDNAMKHKIMEVHQASWMIVIARRLGTDPVELAAELGATHAAIQGHVLGES